MASESEYGMMLTITLGFRCERVWPIWCSGQRGILRKQGSRHWLVKNSCEGEPEHKGQLCSAW